MTFFEELCESLNVKQGGKYAAAVCSMVNALIFDENRTYTDEEMIKIVTCKFKKTFPYLYND
jgi:hypothetical protein